MLDGTTADSALRRAVEIARELDRRDAQSRLTHLFPDETHSWRGETYHARALYPAHMEFFGATARYREAAVMAANRTGKTLASCYAMALFLTGRYPEWWPGRRFPGPVSAWAAGKTNETTRDILQATMLGMVTGAKSDKGLSGTGTVPGDAIGSITWRQGVADLVDTVQVRHVSGGWSTLGLKSYQQGRGSFEGTAKHVIALDEEPDADIYTECLTRTATVDGLIMATFTPLEGLSDVALMFMPGAQD